jgi:hypothetical protein
VNVTEVRNYTLGSYLVAFLDVLGQREKFRALRMPKSPEEHASVGEALRQTAGFVVRLREIFKTQFAEFERGLTKLRQRTNEMIRPNFVGFSDSFVTSVPLWRKDGDTLISVVAVLSALSAAGVVMLTSLASKHALRGGIDIGLATQIESDEIYGTALERAYILECREAKYPRILIGDELWNFLNVATAHFENEKTADAKANKAVVSRAMQMIANDEDGKRILDYLGEITRENASPKTSEVMIRPSYKFVLAEEERALKSQDTKLAERYASLRRYFESRLPLWGLDKQAS